ncbi:CHAT domain-containing protein [Actinophytocola sediminis]
MSGTPAEVLADLSARLRSHDQDGQRGVLLDQPANERAVALCATVLASREHRADATTLRVLGEWFRRRYAVLPAGAGQADLRSARLCAGLLRDLGDPVLTERLADFDGDQQLAIRTSETAMALLDDFDLSGDVRQVASAGSLISELKGMLAPDHPLRGELLVVGGQLAAAMFTIHGDPAHRDDAVRAARAAVAGADPDDPRTVDKIVLLTHTLLTRYDDSAALADLDEAQALVERLVAEHDDPPPPNAVAILAMVLRTRFDRTRRVSDVDRAIVVCRDAIATTPSGHPSLVLLQQSLLVCLLRRAEHLGQEADLNSAIDIAKRIRSELGPAGPIRCATLTSLAVLLVWRYARTQARADLAEAAALSEEAVALSANLRGMRHVALANHVIVLWLRFMDEGRHQDLTDAIELCREALAASTRSVVQVGVNQSMLTRLLTLQASVSGQTTRLAEALEVGRMSAARFSPGHPLRAMALADLAGVYRQRHRLAGDRADLDAAVGLWRAAVHSPAGKPGVRMQVAGAWLDAMFGAGDLAAAAEPAKARVDLLPVVAWRGLDRTGREQRLAGLGEVASVAAALAIELGRPEQAVELLEQGRSVLWAQAIQTRSDLSALHAAAPALAAELDDTRRALDRMSALAEAGGATDRTAHAYRELVERWETLLADARAVPGFTDFLGTAPFETLRTAAAGGAVVIVNVARPRCDALIVRGDGVRAIALPWLTLDSVRRRAAGLLGAITELETGAGPATTNLRQTLGAMARWLWDTVAAPVLDVLDADDPDRAAPHRVWWCPTGPLTLLPLHAAGRYGTRIRQTVPDRTVSSYTTSLSALLRASRHAAPGNAATMVTVGMPHTEGKADLPAVARELDHIGATVPGTRSLVGAAATPDAVLAELRRHRSAHFACHATQDVAEPSRGALHLAGGDLSVRQLATLDLTDAELAYLSACRTAGGSMDLADEAINLAAALQLAGYRNVIGTLWSVADQHAAAVANSVYRALGGATGDHAAALAAATAELRARFPDRPDIWAPFIHLGGSRPE